MDVRRYGEASERLLWKESGAVATQVAATWAMMTQAVIGVCCGNTNSDDVWRHECHEWEERNREGMTLGK